MSETNSTKRILARALKELMSEHPFSRISVSDICSHCAMSRKSFYYHFQDKYDLMNWIFYTEFIRILQDSQQTENPQLLLCICSLFYDERFFYRNAFDVRGQNCFQDYFVEIIRPFVRAGMDELLPQDSHLDFYVNFYTDAFLSAIIRWLNEDSPLPPEDFAELIQSAVLGIVRTPPLQSTN